MININLYPYQIKGIEVMLDTLRNNKGSLLAYDMGLGKTLQAIVVIKQVLSESQKKENSKIIVIAPKILILNWKKELEIFAPEFKIINYAEYRYHVPRNDILLISSSLIIQDLDYFKNKTYYLLVLDEAHMIKNPNLKIRETLKKLNIIIYLNMTTKNIIIINDQRI